MSNRNAVENTAHRKSKVSLAMKINQGLGGPKANPRGAADGQPVNIPAPTHIILRGDAIKVLGRIIGFPRLGYTNRFKNQIAQKSFSEAIMCAVRTKNRHRWTGVNAPR